MCQNLTVRLCGELMTLGYQAFRAHTRFHQRRDYVVARLQGITRAGVRGHDDGDAQLGHEPSERRVERVAAGMHVRDTAQLGRDTRTQPCAYSPANGASNECAYEALDSSAA
jgi:hypothetical protein